MQRILEQNQAGVMQWTNVLYQGQAMIGDEVEVTSFYSDLGTSSCIRHDIVTRVSDGSTLARGHTRWVWMDLATLKPVAIPTDYLAPLRIYFVDGETD